MGMPALQEKRWTAEEVRAMQDQDPRHRYQVVDGELLVSPSPVVRHQACVTELVYLFVHYLRSSLACEVLAGPGEVSPDAYTVVQPDLFVNALHDGRRADSWDASGPLLLAIEVLSPSTARFDRVKKRDKYLAMGAEYWIVDLDARVFEVWRPGSPQPEIEDRRVEWTAPDATEALTLELDPFFRRVLREA
jgi:Uma2 family endonuclease